MSPSLAFTQGQTVAMLLLALAMSGSHDIVFDAFKRHWEKKICQETEAETSLSSSQIVSLQGAGVLRKYQGFYGDATTLAEVLKKAKYPEIPDELKSVFVDTGHRIDIQSQKPFSYDIQPFSGELCLLFGIPIDINQATVEDLMGIPNIGQKTAENIIFFRTEHGKFQRVEDLLAIKGIGPKSLEHLKLFIEVSGAHTKRESD